jgi:DNA-binding PadR family transcriptional regulator
MAAEGGRLSEVEVALLGLVSIRPMYGYEIKHHFDRALAPFWNVPRTQIYPKLRDLDAQGLVVSRHVQQEAKPNRRVYEITDEGRERLRQWLRGPIAWPDMKHSMMAKVFLGHMLPPEETLKLLCDYRDRTRAYRDQLWEIHAKFEPSLKGKYRTSAFFQLVSLEHLIALAELELSGAERLIDAIGDAKTTLKRRDHDGSDELINIIREHLMAIPGGA